MTDEELHSLLRDLESHRVERKESFSDRERVAQAICAFANDMPDQRKPGVLFIGVRDDGSCAGLPIAEKLLLDLADMRSNGNILPSPKMSVEKRVLDGCEVAVVVVEPSTAPPVRYKGQVWIRVGSRRAVANEQEERALVERRRWRDLPYDLHPFETATIADLDLRLFEETYLPASVDREILAANGRSVESRLASLRLVDPEGRPTVVGLLTVGRDPRFHIPGHYIQFLRIDGTEITAPIRDQKELSGPLPDLMRRLDDLAKLNISVATDLSGAVEVRRPDYPLDAILQLARNAVMHRAYEGTHAPVRITWFSDRVEISNPGGPFGQVSPENFGTEGVTDYRNPHVAEAMKNLGYVQKFGYGIPLARKALRANGNPPPEFRADASHVLAVVRK